MLARPTRVEISPESVLVLGAKKGGMAMSSQAFAQGQSRLVAQLEQCGLPKAAITALVGRHTSVRYPKGSPLFLQGSPADVVFAVLSGLVKIYCPGAEGSRILVKLAGPGDVVGYADFLDSNNQRSQVFEARALTSCCVALFTRQHVLEMLKGLEVGVLIRLLELVNSYWSSITYRYAMFLSMSLRQRLELVLSDLGGRFGVSEARGILLTPELAQGALAEMIGSSRPMVSRLLTEMTERGVIARQGRCYILSRGARLDLTPRGLSRVEREPSSEDTGGTRRSTKGALSSVRRGQRQHNGAVGLSCDRSGGGGV